MNHLRLRATRVGKLLTCILLCGCATSTVVRNSGPEPVLFGGTQLDSDIASEAEIASTTTRVCALVDLPFSFIGDTALFPFQVGYGMFR